MVSMTSALMLSSWSLLRAVALFITAVAPARRRGAT
jgi:hypothetical protein